MSHVLGEGFHVVEKDEFWTNLFLTHFLEAPDEHRDDLLFYVKKIITKSKLQIPQVGVPLLYCRAIPSSEINLSITMTMQRQVALQ